MALQACTECGNQVSDKAAACPRCGAPVEIRRSSDSTRQPTASGPIKTKSPIRLPFLVALLIVAFVGWRASRPALRSIGVIPAARFVVDHGGGSDGCSVLGDYCEDTKCVVTNAGDAPGTARIVGSLMEDGGSIVATRTGTAYLNPGQQDTVRFKFNEAKISKSYRSRCQVVN